MSTRASTGVDTGPAAATARGLWPRAIPRTRLYVSGPEVMETLASVLVFGARRGLPVKVFEASFAALFGAPYAVATPSARSSLYHVLMALDLPPGSEIITTPITIHDIVNAILLAGHRPVFVDIDPHSYQMDPAALVAAIGPKSRAVLVTHLFGMAADMDAIGAVCRQQGLALLEDCSHGFGTAFRGRPIGTFGDAGFFSMSSLKSVSASGGGVILSRDRALTERLARQFRQYTPPGRLDLIPALARDLVVALATSPVIFNLATLPAILPLNRINPGIVQRIQTQNPDRLRLSAVPGSWLRQFTPSQASLASGSLGRLRWVNEARTANAEILLERLRPVAPERLPKPPAGSTNTFWRFPFRAPEGRRFQRVMNRFGIDTTTTLLPCCTAEASLADLSRPTPQAERAVREVYFLPVEPSLRPRQVRMMADHVVRYLDSAERS